MNRSSLRAAAALATLGVSGAAHAQTLIDFELGGPCTFASTVALSTEYMAQGVAFSGPAPLDGGAVLDECGGFGVTALSGTNFLAFNRVATLSSGGTATDPQTITFTNPPNNVSIWAAGGNGSGAQFLMQAYNGNTLVDMDTTSGQQFTQMAVSSGGAITHVVLTENSGVKNAFVYDDLEFDTGGPGTIGINYCGPAVANSTGQGAVMSAAGSTVATDNDVTLTCSQMPNNQFGYFLNSQTQSFVFPVPGSQGALCLGGQIGRYNAQIQNTMGTGAISLALDLPNTPTPTGTTAITAGQTWNFECWYRDNNPGPTSNFSDGLEIAFN